MKHLSALQSERGSLPLAMLAVIMVSALMGVVTANVMGGERQTRFDQDYENALQIADRGADQFFSMIKNGQTSSLTAGGSAGCPNSTRAGVLETRCLPQQTVGNTVYLARGEREVGGEWTIVSTATVNGQTRRSVRLRNVQQRPFQHAMFGDQYVSFNGTPRQAYSFNSAVGSAVTNSASLATNASSVIDDQSTYKRPPILLADVDVSSDDAITFATQALADCPAPIPATFTIAAPVPPGVYCVQNLSFADNSIVALASTATQANPVKIYVAGNITVGRRAFVNCGSDGGRCVWPADSTRMVQPGALQIYSVGEGQVRFGTESKIAAAIFAPRSHCFSTPHANVFGSLVCRTIGEFTGHFRLFYDEALANLSVAERRVWSEEPGA